MTDEPGPQEPPPSILKKVLGFPLTPAGAAIAWIAGLVAIPLSIYLYVRPAQHRDLSYYVQPDKTVIVREGQLSRLSVTLDGKPITSDLTAAQVTLWNAGNEAIHRTDFLAPVALTTSTGVRIVEASLQRVSRPVIHAELDTSKFANGEVDVSWNILEGGDRIDLQIVFAGSTSADIRGSAVIEGQPSITGRTPPNPTEASSGLPFIAVVFGNIGVALCAGVAATLIGPGKRSRNRLVLVAACLVLAIAVIIVRFKYS